MPIDLHIKYGVAWDSADPPKIELACIRLGGKWKDSNGKSCGNGLAYHVKAFQSIVWPGKAWHRWNEELILPELCKGGTLAIFGPASSGKTHEPGDFILTMYWAFPDNFTGLCSTTTREMLDMRIWGQIKKRFRQGKERFPWLDGYLIDSRQQITTDGKDVEGREFRNGIKGLPCKKGGEWQGLGDYCGLKNDRVMLVADECFPAGTLVDTAAEPKKIETIFPGDWVYGAAGLARVVATSKRRSKYLVRVTCSDGRVFRCTFSHPVLTNHGWKNAVDLHQGHYIVSQHEAMRILSGEGSTSRETFLRELLSREICPVSAVNQGQALHKGTWIQDIKVKERVLQIQSSIFKSIISENEEEQSNDEFRNKIESFRNIEGDELEASCARRKWYRTDSSRAPVAEAFPGGMLELPRKNRDEAWQWLSTTLQNRRSMAEIETGSRGRRGLSLPGCQTEPRFEKGTSTSGTWVDRVEIQKCANTARDGFSGDGVAVFNLQVEGHPSYSVNGLLVHNCHLMEGGFLQGAANLKSNQPNGKPFSGFSAVYLGNLNDLNSPLGEASEPEHGWDALLDSDKSRVYRTRYMNGRAIQLIGTDSPNLDYQEGAEPFSFMIGRRYLKEAEHDYGKDTPLYNMFAAGKIPRGTMENRVLTKQLCLQFNAFEPVVWSHESIVKIYCADISYTADHGDRSCGMPLGFGRDVEGKLRLASLERPKIFAPSDRFTGTIEEQLARMIKEECQRLEIPSGFHFFFDGTGRSSFTSAAMRVWDTSVNAVEFGGRATERPNFLGRKYSEGPQKGDLLPCCEVFGKLVSELWFAARGLIESDQCRGLSEEVAKEGYARLWKLTPSNKLDVEPKKEMKLRLGRSPDLFDMFVVGIEGARRLGFPIGKVGDRKPRQTAWLRKVRGDYEEALRKQELIAA